MRRALLAVVVVAVALPVGFVASSDADSWYSGPFDRDALAREIPEPMLGAYLDAAVEWEIDWALLAAIGKIECDHGRYRAPGCNPPGTINHAGARGPMQLLGSTWRLSAGRYDLDVSGPPAPDGGGYATDGDGDGLADPWSAYDAVHGAARMLVAMGGRDDPRRAARGYYAGPANPDPTAGAEYADRAVELIDQYHELAGIGGPGKPTTLAQGTYALPFDPTGLHAVTRKATPPRDPEEQLTKPHHSGRVAADIPLPVSTTLYALVSGTVTRAEPSGDCGYMVTIHSSPEQASIIYCHLSTIGVRTGDRVEAGQPIGASGGEPGHAGAGNSTGPHLHLQIETPPGRRCPQPLLRALWRRSPAPAVTDLPRHRCAQRPDRPGFHGHSTSSFGW